MSNPFKPYAANMFADRETIADAMANAEELIATLEGADRLAAWTAFMVLVNTAAKLWPEAPAQVAAPEAPAQVTLAMDRVDLVQLIDARIAGWAENEFDRYADEWLDHHADLDDKIETWVENNLDIEDEIKDVLREATVNISV
jgi:Zn ribbon nucleic-acid-binding protein